MVKSDLFGSWSVHDTSRTFRQKSAPEILKVLQNLEAGTNSLKDLLSESSTAPEWEIEVDILPGGTMKMQVSQPMRPRLDATLKMQANLKWAVEENNLTTETIIDTLTVSIITDKSSSAPKENIGQLEQDALQELKENPQWKVPHTVQVVYCGKTCFLTSDNKGTYMLHFKNKIEQ